MAEPSAARPVNARLSRFGAWLLALALLACCWALPARAATISSGQTVSGTITSGTQIDTYTFPVDVSDSIEASLGTDGTAGYEAIATVYNSGGTQKCTITTGTLFYSPSLCRVTQTSTTTGGTWKVQVKRWTGTGGYKLSLVVIPAATAISGSAGGMMYPGVTYSGTITRGDMQIWMAHGLASTTATVTLVSNQSGFEPQVTFFNPKGVYGGGTTASTTPVNANFDGVGNPDGNFVFAVTKWSGADTPFSYSISVSGAGAALPGDAQTDGAYCATCAAQASNTVGGSSAGDPINTATGNLFEHVMDYTTAGQNPLQIIRYYNSFGYTRNLTPTIMGYNWRTNYDRYLYLNSSVLVVAQRPDGQAINFRCNVTSKVCSPDSDMDYSLSYSGSTWTLTDPDDTVETYSASGTLGTLSSIKLRNGYTQTMNYTAGVLTSVSDSYSRSLGFTYTGGFLTGVTTPDTATLTYGYIAFTSSSLLSTVKYNTSPNTTLTYLYENSSLPYSLTGITDENNKRYATWSYDGSNRALSSALGGLGANQTSVSYSSAGNKVTGPLGIADTYTFTTLNNLPKLTGISRAANGTVAAATESIRYDSNGFLNSRTDWNGNNTSWTNNSHGLPTQITFASNTTNKQVSNLTYDLTWPRLPHTISTTGLNANFTYDSSGNMLTEKLTDTTSQSSPYSTNGQTRTWTNTWNAAGQLLTAQLPRTDVTAKTTYTYSGGTQITVTDALSHVTTVTEAQGGGLATKIRDPNGIFTTRAYNNRNWLTSSVIATSAGNLTTSYNYDSAGNLTKETLPDNSYRSYAYDNAHRRITTTNALSETSNITYDSGGNVTQQLLSDSSGNTKFKHTATFDALGRTLTSVDGQGNSTSFTYDKNSNTLTITNPRNYVTTQTFDQLDRLATYTNAENDLSSILYDSHSRQLSVKDGKGNSTTYVYDGFGDTIQQNSPDSLKTISWFDSDANVTGVNQSGINYSSATYDALDRLTGRTYSGDSSLNTAIYYDSSGHGFGVGHITGGSDATGTFSRSYDERGNMTTDARTIASQLYSTGYTYESAGRLSSITYASSGWVINYGRDSAGQISYVSAKQPMHSAVNLASYVKHMPFGPASSWTYGNGVTDTHTYDKAYRMSGVKDVGTSNVQYLSYSYDGNGNATSITDNVTAGDDQTLTWDRIDRIKSATGAYGTISSITYDSNSNRKTYGATNYTTPGLNNRMSVANGSSITYISTGNISGNGTDTMTYNQANQLKTDTVSGTTSTYIYDFMGIRNKIKTGTTPFQITQYDQNGNLLTETSAAATPVETDYVYLDPQTQSEASATPIAAIQPGAATISALHTDNVGAVLRGTNSSKTIVFTANYDPNGATTPTTSITQNLRRAGQLAVATGANYNLYRTTDTGLVGGGRLRETDLYGINVSPTGFNPYPNDAYNQLRFIDPTGLSIGGASLPLGQGYYGRLDPIPGSPPSFEIHVYNPQGQEIGIYGPEGWINKHGLGKACVPDQVLNTLRSYAIKFLRRAQVFPDRGKADIKGKGPPGAPAPEEPAAPPATDAPATPPISPEDPILPIEGEPIILELQQVR
jgi:YD repeat-containing protein